MLTTISLPPPHHTPFNIILRLHASPPPPPEVSRNPTVTVPEPSPYVRSVSIKSPPNFWSARHPSNVWSVRLPRISRLICVSSPRPYWHFRRQVRHTWLDCSRIPTFAPSMPRGLLSCPRISNWLVVSVANVPKYWKPWLAHSSSFPFSHIFPPILPNCQEY